MLSVPSQRSVVVSAFRYALGRSTYVVSDTATALKEAAELLPRSQRQQIIDEIEMAIESDRAGMAMDIAVWRELQEFFRDLEFKESNDEPDVMPF